MPLQPLLSGDERHDCDEREIRVFIVYFLDMHSERIR